MKYYRKQPVEAIQWNGDNQIEVLYYFGEFISDYHIGDDGCLTIIYIDSKNRKHQVAIPKFGWIVVEGKMLQFYKDETFRKTFEPAYCKGPIWSSAQEMVDMIDK